MPSKDDQKLSEEETALAAQLKAVREEAGLDRAQMAEALEFSSGQISKIERAARSVSVETMIKWFRVCGYHVDTVSMHGTSRAADVALAIATMPEADLDTVIRFAEVWKHITGDVRRAFLAMIETYERDF